MDQHRLAAARLTLRLGRDHEVVKAFAAVVTQFEASLRLLFDPDEEAQEFTSEDLNDFHDDAKASLRAAVTRLIEAANAHLGARLERRR